MPILTLVPIVLTIAQQFFPVGSSVAALSDDIAAIFPSLLAAAQTELALFQSGTAPSASQLAQIEAALDQANALLQASQPGAATA